MTYRLGVDLGTTFTAAAVANGGPPTMLGLGNRALQVPSVLYLPEDGDPVVGEAAERRGLTDPSRVVREFKRRIGDHVPMLVAGVPYSPQALTAQLLHWVVQASSNQVGELPESVILTYPANWGPYKRELLNQVVQLADVGDVRTCSEPEAAAVQYAAKSKIQAGARIAMYDLGGGTFDTCVLEKRADGFVMLGEPVGIEHLGGIDFDDAVFQHVIESLGDMVSELDPTDPQVQTALARLRRECVDAKEALSSDAQVTIPVTLPGWSTSIRMTRSELEDLVRPPLEDTVTAVGRAIRSAGIEPADLHAIVLIGGGSRIPLVRELLQQAFPVPTALDTHPKHDVALGAVQVGRFPAQCQAGPVGVPPIPVPASHALPADAPASHTPPVDAPPVDPPAFEPPASNAPVADVPAARISAAQVSASGAAETEVADTEVADPVSAPDDPLPLPTPPPRRTARPAAPSGRTTAPVPAGPTAPPRPAGPTAPPRPAGPTAPPRPVRSAAPSRPAGLTDGPDAPAGSRRTSRNWRNPRWLALGGVVAALVVGASALALTRGDDPSRTPDATATTQRKGSALGLPAVPASAPLAKNRLVVPMQLNDNWDIYLADADVSVPIKRLTSDPRPDSTPVLSPDRGTVIFVHYASDKPTLRVMAADGTGVRNLFRPVPPQCATPFRPAWNPVDSTMLAIACLDRKGTAGLYLVRTDGRMLRRLPIGQPRVDDVAFSPDGKSVTYQAGPSSRSDGGSIFTIPIDGGGPQQLTKGVPGMDADPTWSADGKQIAFRRRLPDGTIGGNGNFDIFVVPADGSGTARAIVTGASDEQDPSWSPDGDQLAIKTDRRTADEKGEAPSDGKRPRPSRIWLVRTDGTNLRPLWTSGASGDQGAPAWSRR